MVCKVDGCKNVCKPNSRTCEACRASKSRAKKRTLALKTRSCDECGSLGPLLEYTITGDKVSCEPCRYFAKIVLRQHAREKRARIPAGFDFLELGFDRKTKVEMLREVEDKLEALRPKVSDSQPIPVGYFRSKKDDSIHEFAPTELESIATALLRPDEPGQVHPYPVIGVDANPEGHTTYHRVEVERIVDRASDPMADHRPSFSRNRAREMRYSRAA